MYLGYRAYKSWRNYNPDEAISETSGKQTLFSAALVNLFNPNPYLGWSLIMGPTLLQGWRIDPINGVVLMLGFYVTITIMLAATILLFAFARKLGPRVNKISLGISSLVLILFGVYQLYMGFSVFF